MVIEVPAGLIDEGETPAECAVRELKEETGFVGVAGQVSPVMFNGMFSDFQKLNRYFNCYYSLLFKFKSRNVPDT